MHNQGEKPWDPALKEDREGQRYLCIALADCKYNPIKLAATAINWISISASATG